MNTNRYVAGILIMLFCILLFSFGLFKNVNHRMTDTLYGKQQQLQNIVIISVDDKSLQEIGRWPWNRDTYIAMLDNIHGEDLIGMDIAFFERSQSKTDIMLGAAMRKHKIVAVSEYTDFMYANFTNVSKIDGTLLRPIREITSPTGYANIILDEDGVARALNLDVGNESAFSSALYKQYTGVAFPRKSRFVIHYGLPNAYQRISATDVINGRIAASAFKGKIVLIGVTYPDAHDDAIVPTSEGTPMPGVEIHANALQTMLRNNELTEAPQWLIGIFIILSVLLVGIMTTRVSITTSGIITAVMIFAYFMISLLLFNKNIVLNMVYVPSTIIFSFIIFAIIDLIDERITKKRVSDAFRKYVTPALLNQIYEKEVSLGGENKEITTLFSDIRGFTSISEKLTPEELVDFLNSYFTRVTKIIMDERGLVDKFIGDAIMAFWNAPLADANHADRAVAAALRMKEALDIIRKEHEGKYPRIDIGIGINTGDAIVGNIGSIERLSYTAIGDSVNLASRIEGLTKEYGVQILISQTTRKKLKTKVLVRELDRVKVKGKSEPVTLYEVLGYSLKKEEIARNNAYESGLHAYYGGEWKKAIKILSKLDDRASSIIIGRCNDFMRHPPKKWKGIYEMTHK